MPTIAEKDTLFKDRERPKTIPYSAARTYIAHIGQYPPPPGKMTALSQEYIML